MIVDSCRRAPRPAAATGWLDVEVADVERVDLDELATRLDEVAHQGREDLLGRSTSPIATSSRLRRAGSIVVSQSCSAFISPRPL
jgi:uncharacterized ferredoxin-like protein